MARLSLSLLGPVRITLDGQPVGGFAYNKARALLAYLAVQANRSHHRDTLVGLLWPELPDTAARTNLRQALANLREAIGDASATPPFLLITRDTIQVNPRSDYDLDVAAFTALLTACATHAHRHLARCRACAARMKQAISLYRGDFLAEFALSDSAPFEEWQLRHREQLHQQALDALAHLAEYHERRGDDEQARRAAQRQIELDPWREEAHRQLMWLLARGDQRSAALAQYATCRRVLARDLGVEPATETTALYKRIRDATRSELRVLSSEFLTHGPETQNSERKTQNLHSFPAPTTPLIGREAELVELGALLEHPACRLITIVGPGGIGKTRLALAAAAEQAEAFTDGVAFVPLAAISAAAFLAPAILAALNAVLQGQRNPREQLLDYLRAKELLLVLDNVEHLLAGAELLADILQGSPGVTLLVTSRERLALQGEWLFDLSGLSYPIGEPVDRIETYSSVQLFLQRAGQVRRHFAPVEGEARAVARICQLVEGLPLAIELAADALRGRSCISIAAAAESNVSALTAVLRSIPERHRSMWATFEYSWRLLSDEEQQIFRRLSVFRGGFSHEAATAVCNVLKIEKDMLKKDPAGEAILNSQFSTLNLIRALADKSLLRWDRAARYDLHELLRQYANEKLAEAGEVEATRHQHAAYYLALAEAVAPALKDPMQRTWPDRMERELDNIWAALDWGLECGAAETTARIGAALCLFWEPRSST